MQKLQPQTRFIIALIVILTCIGCDQATKHLAQTNLPRWHVFSYFGDSVRLQYAENAGAAFSLGATLPENIRWWIFVIGQGVFLFLLAAYFLRNSNQHISQFFGFTLILGGGLGNFLDRILRDGVVVDFLNIGIGNIRTAIFNIADVAITTGLLLLLYGVFLKKEDHDGGNEADSSDGDAPVDA